MVQETFSVAVTNAPAYMQGLVDFQVRNLTGAYAGQPMRLIHRRSGLTITQYSGPARGAQGPQKYGQFGWTTFMTRKSRTQRHPFAKMWVGRVIVSRERIAAPGA